jgi:hypothetical protein
LEIKWGGFRAIISTEDGLRVRSRRGWNMTPVLLPELRNPPTGPPCSTTSWSLGAAEFRQKLLSPQGRRELVRLASMQ